MLERMMQALSWIVNFSLLGERGGATLGWGCGGRLEISSQASAVELGTDCAEVRWGFQEQDFWILPSESWWMPDWSLDRFYTQELSNKYNDTQNMCPSEMHGELFHRNSQSIRAPWVPFAKHNYRHDGSKFKIKVPFNKVKAVVKLCSSQCLSWRTECLDAL